MAASGAAMAPYVMQAMQSMMGGGQGGGNTGFTGGFGGFGGGGGMSNLGNILSGLGVFGDAGAPYKDASNVLKQYLPEAQKYQQPFYNAGVGAIPDYQKWLKGMSDPSGFINNLMGQYQQSPWAKYQQQQATRAAQNMGSASGLIGSTPLMEQAQTNAANISNQDMNQWLQNVLGINTQYGAGEGALMQGGQGAANSLTQLLSDYMRDQAKLQYAETSADQGQRGGLFGGIVGAISHGLFS